MGYRNSPAYVQRMIDRILRPFRAFARAYVDDIVIYSNSLEELVDHLHQVFQTTAVTTAFELAAIGLGRLGLRLEMLSGQDAFLVLLSSNISELRKRFTA